MKKLGLIILFVLLAFSCKNSIDNKNSKKGYGLINFTSTSRTVQADFDVESFENICLYGKNIEEGTDYILLKTWDVYDSFISDSLSIAVGSYEFYLTAKIGNVEFKSDIESVVIGENTVTTIIFELIVTNRGTGKGTVELQFTFGESNPPVMDGSFELNKITYESNTRKKSTVDLSDNALVVTPFNYDTREAASAIFSADLDPGVYELISRFEVIYEEEPLGVAVYPVTIHVSEGQTSSDEIEVLNFNNYYSIEYIGVEENLISDFPTKYSIYDEVTIQNLTDEGYNKFQGWYTEEDEKIEKISKYERTGDLSLSAKWHLDSQYMLFSKESAGYTSFAMTSDLSSSVEPENVGNLKITDFTIGGGDFLYYLTEAETKTIKKYNDPYFNLPCDYTNDYSEAETIEMLYYDYKTDKTYGISDQMNSMYIIEDETSCIIGWNGYSGYKLSLLDFAIDEDKLYIVCLNYNMQTGVSRYEVIYFTKQTDNTYQYKETINIDTTSIPNDYFYINDMICMEGKVYILWNYKSYASSNVIYNYGGILCVDEQNECSQLLPYLSPENLTTITTTDPNDKTKKVSVKYQGPLSTNYTYYLFGPKKFVAIKPKKLVIADEGLFVYADSDENGTAEAENVNRVVTIDLDNLSTPFVSQNVSVLFNENSPENTTVTFCCAYELDIKTPSIITSVQ